MHGGTHLYAPVHFHEPAMSTDELPLDSQVASAVVIDVAEQLLAVLMASGYRLG
ncbi:MAG: cyclase family protein [Gammaproteobacteria bacterium]|nr:hypothetical protein [Gammaproteobacteria bacterium]NIO61712.1 hypothetical protein [Gammaproteobacteria bacterium]NIP49332.1 cyclase family protein [Gammaproteobacteria bacterium]NIQ10554.1 cyclase family protein [Gammaproteobacteria bacterium]NIQ18963.1 hypothetical protein [Gammaproteobacteria bacterium]